MTADYGCTFGSRNRVDVISGSNCRMVVTVYGQARSASGSVSLTKNLGTVRVPLCRQGWTDALPSPWNLPR